MMGMTKTAISGYVQSSLTNVSVSAQKAGVVVKATKPDSTGKFVLAPLDPTKGPYDVVITGPALTTSVIAAVAVTPEQTTQLNAAADAIAVPISSNGTVTGNVGPALARDTAVVRALQAVGSLAAVEVAHVNVTASTGDYSLVLPTAAPRLVTYTTPWNMPITFVAQGGAGSYKLEAGATGYDKQLGSSLINVTAGATVGSQNFTLTKTP